MEAAREVEPAEGCQTGMWVEQSCRRDVGMVGVWLVAGCTVRAQGSPCVSDEARVARAEGKGRRCVLGLRQMSMRVQCAEHTRQLHEQYRPALEPVVLLAVVMLLSRFCQAAANRTGLSEGASAAQYQGIDKSRTHARHITCACVDFQKADVDSGTEANGCYRTAGGSSHLH